MKANMLYRDYSNASQDPVFTGDVLEIDLSTIKPSLAGPKRPQDHVNLSDVSAEFNAGLKAPVGFKGFGYSEEELGQT